MRENKRNVCIKYFIYNFYTSLSHRNINVHVFQTVFSIGKKKYKYYFTYLHLHIYVQKRSMKSISQVELKLIKKSLTVVKAI